jgi:hypothetical protein
VSDKEPPTLIAVLDKAVESDGVAELTAMVTASEATVTGVPELSVTWSSKNHVPVAVEVVVENEAEAGDVQEYELPRSLKPPAP